MATFGTYKSDGDLPLQGGGGSLYCCYDTDGKKVAVKVIHKNRIEGSEGLER